MEADRKRWDENQKVLRQKLPKGLDFEDMKQLLLKHHAMVHSATMAQLDVWSYEDEIWQGLSDANARRIPAGHEHSIIWTLWHSARIEDITMSFLVAGHPEILITDRWLEKLNISLRKSGNNASDEDLAALNQSMDIAALRAYRQAVGRGTQKIIRSLNPETVKQKVDLARIQQLRETGAIVEAASDLIDYWSRRTIAGLLLMPATRHNFVHLNEAARIKRALI